MLALYFMTWFPLSPSSESWVASLRVSKNLSSDCQMSFWGTGKRKSHLKIDNLSSPVTQGLLVNYICPFLRFCVTHCNLSCITTCGGWILNSPNHTYEWNSTLSTSIKTYVLFVVCTVLDNWRFLYSRQKKKKVLVWAFILYSLYGVIQQNRRLNLGQGKKTQQYFFGLQKMQLLYILKYLTIPIWCKAVFSEIYLFICPAYQNLF